MGGCWRSYGRGSEYRAARTWPGDVRGSVEEQDKTMVAKSLCCRKERRWEEEPVAGPRLQREQSAADEWGLPFPRWRIVSNLVPFYDRTHVLVKGQKRRKNQRLSRFIFVARILLRRWFRSCGRPTRRCRSAPRCARKGIWARLWCCRRRSAALKN